MQIIRLGLIYSAVVLNKSLSMYDAPVVAFIVFIFLSSLKDVPGFNFSSYIIYLVCPSVTAEDCQMEND